MHSFLFPVQIRAGNFRRPLTSNVRDINEKMKYAITFFLLACTISAYAIRHGGWWHLLNWFAMSLFILAIGYAGIGPQIFGKQPSGKLRIWARVLHLPFLLYTWSVWHIFRKMIHENPTDQVTHDVIIGRRLQPNELPKNIEHFIDLTAEFEEPKIIRESKGYLSLPILDGGVPTIQELDETILKVPSGVTYIHCAQGHCRTGLFALALLFSRGHIQSVEDGLYLLKKVRPGVGLNSTQMKFVRNYIAEQ